MMTGLARDERWRRIPRVVWSVPPRAND